MRQVEVVITFHTPDDWTFSDVAEVVEEMIATIRQHSDEDPVTAGIVTSLDIASVNRAESDTLSEEKLF